MRIIYLGLPKKPDRSNRCDFCMNKSKYNILLGGIRSIILCEECHDFVKVKPRFDKKKYEMEVKNYLELKNQIKDNLSKLKEYKSKL